MVSQQRSEQCPSVSWNPGSVQPSVPFSVRAPALFPRQCGNNASKSAAAFRHFLLIRHTRPGSWGGRGAGAGRYIDSPPPPPQSPLVAEGRLEPSPRRPAAGCSTVGNTLLSPTPHKSFSDTPVSDNSINNTSALSPVAGLVNVGHRADSSPGGLLTSRQGRHSLPRERMAKIFGPGFTLLTRPTDKCPAWSN